MEVVAFILKTGFSACCFFSAISFLLLIVAWKSVSCGASIGLAFATVMPFAAFSAILLATLSSTLACLVRLTLLKAFLSSESKPPMAAVGVLAWDTGGDGFRGFGSGCTLAGFALDGGTLSAEACGG